MKCELCESGTYCEVHDGPIEPEPVRTNLVPLTVRRHTPESRAIWRANLLNALPVDMPDEDAQHIADEMLEVAITQGNALRRKRLIDRLVAASEEMAAYDGHTNPPVTDWSDLMDDVAEELRNLL